MKNAKSNSNRTTSQMELWIDGDEVAVCGDGKILELGESASTAEQLVMNGVLLGHLEKPALRERRIQATLAAFERQRVSSNKATAPSPHRDSLTPHKSTNGKRRVRQSMAVLTLTAAVMVVFFAWGVLSPQSAEASLRRVIAATRMPVTRVYQARIYRQFLGREYEKQATLYIRSDDLFVAEFSETTNRPRGWIGFDGNQRWLVGQDFRWSSEDESELGVEDIVDRMTSRSMHFNALLNEIPGSFELRLLPSESIEIGDETLACQPIEATPRDPQNRLEKRILIWPHPETGAVMEMHLFLKSDRPLGVRRIEFQYQREQTVPEGFFTPNHHQM